MFQHSFTCGCVCRHMFPDDDDDDDDNWGILHQGQQSLCWDDCACLHLYIPTSALLSDFCKFKSVLSGKINGDSYKHTHTQI